jgi:predicted nucleic acid-binding Zn ribbon protein
MSDDPLVECPECDEDSLRRVINSVGVVFKGSGFYVTDSRNGRNGSSNGSSAASTSSTPEKSSETKTESKSEKKSDTSKEGASSP